jgi:hypothetical protein
VVRDFLLVLVSYEERGSPDKRAKVGEVQTQNTALTNQLNHTNTLLEALPCCLAAQGL